MQACRVCAEDALEVFLSLGPCPLANAVLGPEQLESPERVYPLDVCYCHHCGLVQLADVISPRILFTEYSYLTGASEPMQAHFRDLAATAVARQHMRSGSLVVDIGSNDGTLLSAFKARAMRGLGVEPADNVAELARRRGVETITAFFSPQVAEDIARTVGRAAIVVATNVFAHVDDLGLFLRGVDMLLEDNGIFIIEVPHLLEIVEHLEFDTIYHEHLSYFSVRPLLTILNRFGLTITAIEQVSVHGGSLRVSATRDSGRGQIEAIRQLIGLEHSRGLYAFSTYLEFAGRVRQVRNELRRLLQGLRTGGRRIVGYGAPAKGNTLLNFCQIGRDILDYVVDTTPLKQGKYTPGMHIPIVTEDHFRNDAPDFALILAWNYADSIARKEARFRSRGGRFIVPIPHPVIV